MTKSIVKVCLALSAALLLFTILSPYSPARTEKILKFESGDTLEEIRYKIAHNGYNFTVGENWVTRLSPEERDRLLNRHYPLSPRRRNAHDEIGPLVKHLGKKLPSSLDWRNYNGHAYIGPIQNQGSCGSCYAFGAAAAAEGTYNWATGKYDGNRADLSEAFIAFCLSDHYSGFDGCNGANYDYEELQALVDYGICTEAQYPYTDYEQACPLSPYPPLTQFQSWHRIPCNDIDAIKTAIMTYGVVDAAVQAGSAWLGYSGGIYQDSNTSCYEDPCYYTPTNHAISLVGWDDNPPEGGGGVWILRNSHGTSFGESGYMRIRYTSAYVSCEACYMVFSAPPPPYPTIIDEGFDDFQNGTRPSGWTFTDCNQNSDTYIAPESYYGAALPSLKLNASSATIITETFSNPRLLTFWIRGVETGGDAGSLLVEEFYGGGWTTVTDLTSLPLEAATSGPYPLYTDTTQLRFNFTQNIGNLAFDDVKVYQGTTPTPTLTPRTPTPTATPTVTPTPSLTPYGWKTPSPTVTPTPFGEIPFTEDFEGIWASGVPAGWSKEYITGTTDWVQGIGCDDGDGKPPAAHGGSYNALIYYDDPVTKVTRLISPRLIFGSKTQNTQLTFWHAQGDWNGYYDTLKVYYKTSAGGSWTLLQSYTAAVDTWTERTISLPNPGDDYYLCFEGTTNWGWGVCVDDVSITGESTGPTPPPPTPPGPTPVPPLPTPRFIVDSGDYNGDGTADIGVFRGITSLWAIRGFTMIYFGQDGDLPVSGDYDGDGISDIAIFRPSSNLWAVRDLSRNYFGQNGDFPCPGDYDGDGTADRTVFRADSHLWAVRGLTRIYFGGSGDQPIPADFSGDGTEDIAIFRNSNSLWALRQLSRLYFGTGGDWPLPGDYTGDGITEIAIFRPEYSLWALRGISRYYHGGTADWPIPADYSGDGSIDIGTFRPSTSLWAIREITRVYFGSEADIPVTR